MKTIETQKAELLDWFIGRAGIPNFFSVSDCSELRSRYNAITDAVPLSENPYCSSVMSVRLIGVMIKHFERNGLKFSYYETRLSECPHIYRILRPRNFGPKTQQEYIDLMRRYGFNDKIE